jgi:hypothetical protein
MKRYLIGLIIALVMILSCGAVYGGDKPIETTAEAVIPAAWGTLRSVIQFPNFGLTYLYLEDSKGTIRKVTLGQDNALYGATVVIKRSE